MQNMSMNKYKKGDNPFEDEEKEKKRKGNQVESMMPQTQNKKACADCTIF